GVKDLTVFIFWGDDFDFIADFGAQHCEGVFIQRLVGCGHFAKVEQDSDQCCRICLNLIGEISDGGTAAQTNNCVAVTLWNLHTANDRCLLVLFFIALTLLRTTAASCLWTATERTLR